MRCSVVAALPLLFVQWGCTVTAVSASDDSGLRNSCSADSDCSGAETCRTNVCQTPDGGLDALLITAAPPSDSALPHLTFLSELEEVPSGGKAKLMVMPGPAQVIGSLSLPTGQECYPSFQSDDPTKLIIVQAVDRTVPVTVTLALRQRLLGLSQQVYYGKTAFNDLGGYTFEMQVPAGEYDVYLAPPKRQEGDCVVPPQLYRDFPIGIKENSETNAAIKFKLSAISKLNLRVRQPLASPSLKGWTADIIEPFGGNPISTEKVFLDPSVGVSAAEYLVSLAYSTVAGSAVGGDTSSDLLRFRPPEGLVAPTIFLDRSALGLLQANPEDWVDVTALTHVPSQVNVHGQLLRRDGGSSIAGSVTFISTEIYGVDPGVFGSYQTTVQAKADGLIDVALPPGRYRVQGEPLLPHGAPQGSQLLSAAETIWEVPADLPVQFGKVLELPAVALTGTCRVPGAEVRLLPSPHTASPFEQAFGAGSVLPRPSSGLVDDGGSFTLQVDPGRFDLVVQAPEKLGFGWFVRPGLRVGAALEGAGAALEDVGRVPLAHPHVLAGQASLQLPSGAEALASAAIRAYAYLDKDLAYTRDPKQAVSVIQVAESRADEQGNFRLLLPTDIAASK